MRGAAGGEFEMAALAMDVVVDVLKVARPKVAGLNSHPQACSAATARLQG